MAKQTGKSGPTYDNIPDLTAWLRGIWEGACPDESPNGEVLADWLAPFNRGEKRLRGMKPRDLRDAIAKAEFYSWYAEQGMIEPAHWGLEATLHDLKVLLQREKETPNAAGDIVSKMNGQVEAAPVEGADPAGAYDLAFHSEEAIRPVEQVNAALDLIASARGLDPVVSDALYGLSNRLEAAIEDVTEAFDAIADKTVAFYEGRAKVVSGEARQ